MAENHRLPPLLGGSAGLDRNKPGERKATSRDGRFCDIEKIEDRGLIILDCFHQAPPTRKAPDKIARRTSCSSVRMLVRRLDLAKATTDLRGDPRRPSKRRCTFAAFGMALDDETRPSSSARHASSAFGARLCREITEARDLTLSADSQKTG